MADYIFFYGTLLPERAPAEISGAVQRLKRVGRGVVKGELFNLGAYPGAKLDPGARTTIKGEVFEIPSDRSLLRELDRYEGFQPSRRANSLFIRKRFPVRLHDRTLRCWIYEYNRKPAASKKLPNGRFVESRRVRSGV